MTLVERRVPRTPRTKLAEQVSRRIEDDIIERDWPVGEVLGAAAHLADRYGVSQAVLREAISILEYKQVAVMRRGRGGGLVVQAPAAAVVAESVAAFFHFADVSADELYDARTTLEVLSARLAAHRLDEDDIVALREIASNLPPGRPLSVAIARASGNPVVAIFVPTLTRVTGALAGDAGEDPRLGEPVASERHRALRAIAEAVISGDEATAERRVRSHLESERSWLTRIRQARSDADVSGLASPDTLGEQLAHTTEGKLPEKVALLVRQEIHRRGWPTGEVIGNEATLLADLGVSRAVLREAVRILEHNGVARMRQGPGGGLVVQAPDHARVVDALALYLRYLRVRATELFEVRTAVELRATELAAARAPRFTPEERAELSAVLKRVRSPSASAHTHVDLHVTLAALSGNRLLGLFAAVLARLTPFRIPDDEDVRLHSREVDERIAEAVLSGDASLARHRMTRHMEGLAPWLDDDAY
ncbi:FadR family transcriptional regulator [Actinomadura sp. KC345]|uniref:FadR/GntR family transcriptional regulator n=1 Tax=Actinomadura sp. KC345 TaxID=2530371 RepID=UPI001050D588|nr:FCD domain-containing protein [Actinomadura sp. KC345]TDC55932.1 FadR family transcriptional regulator [Actinomadura sp. KC345]